MSFETKHVRMIAEALEARPSIAQRCIRIALSAIPAQRRLLIREKLKDERFVMPKTAGVKDRVLTSSESKLLRSHLINDETHRNRWLYLFLLNTGCRIGEALAITTSAIDIQNMTVEIDAHVVTKLEEKNGKIRKVRKSVNSTKTKQSRKIHLNMDAMLAIEEALRQKARFRQEGGVIHQGDLIFCDEFGDPLDYHLTNRRFVAICNKLGIQGATQHTLRTTYATNLAAILPQGKAHLGSVILGNSPEVFAKHYNKLAGLQGTEFAKELTIGGEN
jgi:integrase